MPLSEGHAFNLKMEAYPWPYIAYALYSGAPALTRKGIAVFIKAKASWRAFQRAV